MAYVYILHSKKIDKYYIGSCLDLNKRITEHKQHNYNKGFTHRADDWELYFVIVDLPYETARKIERHIKRMKSRKYIENLKRYPEISKKLIKKYN